MALPSGSPTVRGEPTGTRGRAGRHCAASRARRSSSTATTKPSRRKAATPQGRLLSVLQSYQASGEFHGLAARTRRDYVEQDQGHRSRVWRFPAVGADRPAHARHLHGVARQARRQVTAAGRLCVAGARARLVVGSRSRAGAGESVRARRSALSRLTASTRSGPPTTRRPFSDRRRRICTCRCCSRCGPGSGRAICCACRGRPMTARTSGCGKARPARVS